MASHYKLGTYAGGAAGMVEIDVLLSLTKSDPFPTTFQPYSDNSEIGLDGVPIEQGLPIATWHWDWLPQPDIEALRDICASASAAVYVRTRNNTHDILEFITYTATMLRPVIGDMVKSDNGVPFYPQVRGPVDVTFINLTAVP